MSSQCPKCHRPVDEDYIAGERLVALQEAFQIEVESHHFYRRLAEAVDDPEASDFFESLSQMEKDHAEEISKKYHLHPSADLFQDTGKPLPHPFFEPLRFFADTGNFRRLYDSAISLEKKTLDFFEKNAKTLPPGKERDLYLELAAEEEGHIALLESQRDR